VPNFAIEGVFAYTFCVDGTLVAAAAVADADSNGAHV
jgi:hypothetical protein